MGLSITVGVLADLLENDEEGASWVAGHFTEINELLKANGLQEHAEPEKCDAWSRDGYGYSGLHALREIAGLVWMNENIPHDVLLTGTDTPYEEKLFATALPLVLGEDKRGWVSKLFRKKQEAPSLHFLHLVVHSDAEGYYVPVDFPLPLVPSVMTEDSASIWPLGSVQQLKRELITIKSHLQIPDGLTSQSENLEELLESDDQRKSGLGWEAQPIATYSALIMLEACEASLKTGAAISFG